MEKTGLDSSIPPQLCETEDQAMGQPGKSLGCQFKRGVTKISGINYKYGADYLGFMPVLLNVIGEMEISPLSH